MISVFSTIKKIVEKTEDICKAISNFEKNTQNTLKRTLRKEKFLLISQHVMFTKN